MNQPSSSDVLKTPKSRCISGSVIAETIGSDNVFEETDLATPIRPKQAFTFNRSLSAYKAELPDKNSRLRRFTVHSRDNFTNTWLKIHDFRNSTIKETSIYPRHRTFSMASLPESLIISEVDLEVNPPIHDDDDDEGDHTSSPVVQKDHNELIPNRPAVIGYDNNSMKSKDNETISNVYNDEKMRNFGMSRASSLSSQSRNDDIPSSSDHSERWIDNVDAKNSVIIALTVFYALIVTIFALVLELSHLLSSENTRMVQTKDLIFGLYMYGISIIFLFYCYMVLLLNPRWNTVISKLKSWIRFRKFSSESTVTLDLESSVAAATIHRKVTHDSPSAGSLFLRLGSVVFGVIGTVFYAFSAFLCLNDQKCDKITFSLDICAILFIFTQMHFVFCNWKMTIMGHHTIARFGTMHLLAANVWTWIRYVLIEESVMDKEIRHIFTDHSNSGASKPGDHATTEPPEDDETTDFARRIARSAGECSGSDYINCVLGSITDIMYTSIVEYSLIGAVVMFIVWRNIDHVKTPTTYVKRKHQIRVDCSKTTSGLFFGLAFLAGTFTSMAVFYGYSLIGKNHTAAFVFSITDIIQYVIASLACIYALYQMRKLRYYHSSDTRSNVNPNQELLDMILLSLGMIGEMIYSVAGLVGLTGDKTWQSLSVVLFVCHITRLMQVGLQCCLIYIAGKLRIKGDLELRKKQPGKQVITFLLIANIAMFLMNLFESEKAGVSETVVNFYGKRSWVFLVRSFSPLTIFYRFHSSVCFAEVWKNAYAWKD